jgi:2'-5' RNA ligase
MGVGLTEARRIYEQLWSKTGALLKSGRMRIDARLQDKAGDDRRGVTLVARPDAGVKKKVGNFLREAAVICPRQHFYRPAELHLTVLTIIPGSAAWRDQIHRLPDCQMILEKVLKNRRAFSVDFRGVTASPDAVLIQGFPADDLLAGLRDELRNSFRQHGVDENLDRRYKIATAHLTAMRFSHPKANWTRLLSLLEAHRETGFGETRFQSVQLIWTNWYASTGVVRVLQEYPLKD